MRRSLVALTAVAAAAVVPAGCGEGSSGFCDAIKELESRGDLGTSVGVGTDPGRVLEVFRANQAILVRMRDSAPDDIEPDAARLADAYAQVVAAIDRNAGNLAQADQEVSIVLDDPETDAAFERVIVYAGEECDL